MPDGAYYLKIAATDSPSNPAGQALSTERQSDRFEIANTPPRIEDLRADASGATVKISFVGISSSDAIGQAQYSLDAGDWQIVLPGRTAFRRARRKVTDSKFRLSLRENT